MAQRYLSLWFRHLTTDWLTRRRPALQDKPFVFSGKEQNREVVTAVSATAQAQGVHPGMVLADARALVPGLEVVSDAPTADILLHRFALWCIRYTPIVAVDPPDGLILDISGCAHLWGGEAAYYKDIVLKLRAGGYNVRGAIADTIGCAWAVARFGQPPPIVPPGAQKNVLLRMSPPALRVDQTTLARLRKLGFSRIDIIVKQPRGSLTPRFGKQLLQRLDQAFGAEPEYIVPVVPPVPFQERLPCLEPIVTAGGIEYALTRLLESLCRRLQQEGKGIRTAVFRAFRVDGKTQELQIGTTRATYNINHLFKLFELNIPTIEPDLGIELFILEAPKVEDAAPLQESLWGGPLTTDSIGMAELLDRIATKISADVISRYLPAQHHWPERSIQVATSNDQQPPVAWPKKARPFHLLPQPEPIAVTAPIPDYPPMLFIYRGARYKVVAANGPERIENEWWTESVRHRDYYVIEDEDGGRYWIFRAGHYSDQEPARWFIHGFFA
jgi:protein ImuB